MVTSSTYDDVTGKEKHKKVDPFEHRSYFTNAVHLLMCGAGILGFYFAFGIFQEEIVQGTYANSEKFAYIQTLVFCVCLASAIFAYFIRGRHDVDNVPQKEYVMCAGTYVMAMLCSNLALQYLPYPTQSCKPIPVMLFGVLFVGKRYALKKYFYVLMIVAGVALFMYKDKKTKDVGGGFGIGELLLLGSLACDGTTTTIQERIKKNYHRTTASMMFYMNLHSSLFLFVAILINGELLSFIDFIGRNPSCLTRLFLLSVCSCGGQYFIFKTVHEFSPLTCSILTTTRKLLTIVISVFLFNHPLSDRQVFATVLVFTGLFLDASDSKTQKKKVEA